MLRPDVWTWMSIHLLPDYLFWRWAKPDWTITEARVSGSIHRNEHGPLWLRGLVYDRDSASDVRWGMMTLLPENSSLAILYTNPRLASTLAVRNRQRKTQARE